MKQHTGVCIRYSVATLKDIGRKCVTISSSSNMYRPIKRKARRKYREGKQKIKTVIGVTRQHINKNVELLVTTGSADNNIILVDPMRDSQPQNDNAFYKKQHGACHNNIIQIQLRKHRKPLNIGLINARSV